ncbi:FecR family protein [Steroidobacter sp.]|uniref:FecR family protein n=1 Tax=Steroidobacter sp. TaxID=1978227 RepID=UPI001A3F96DA|nr:FecR domain-containing protein [Steroidobacter sp.]MBL8267507.1 FecR domain-containing protein [Steroidobacter sp.]
MRSEVEDTAAAWAARVDKGGLQEDEQRELDAWLASDRRHLGAFVRMQTISAHFDRAAALGADFDARQFSAPPNRVRRTVWIGGLIAASCAALVVYLFVLGAPTQHYATGRGEIKNVSLDDGSVLRLNTATRVDVRFSAEQRRVQLLEGEALFDVAKDPARPFVVEAAGTLVRAVGTSFTVRVLPGDQVKVLVREGVVEVSGRNTSPAAPLQLSANNRVHIGRDPVPAAQPVSTAELADDLAWQSGMISLDGITLQEAVSEFSRYSDTRIVIDDGAIAELTVTGRFAADDPVGFAKAVATSMSLQATVEPGEVHLHR